MLFLNIVHLLENTKKIRELFGILLPLLMIVLLSACSTIFDAHGRKTEVMQHYQGGNFIELVPKIEDYAQSYQGTGDGVMWALEAGTSCFEAGEYERGLAWFEAAETAIQGYDKRAAVSLRDISAEAGSLITNPNAIPYRGYYYDRIFLPVYKAMIYMSMRKNESAMVELRRLREVQSGLQKRFTDEITAEEKTISESKKDKSVENAGMVTSHASVRSALSAVQEKAKFSGNLMNPYAVWLSMLGYIAEENYAEAMVDARQLYAMNPTHTAVQQDYAALAKAVGDKLPAELSHLPAASLRNRVYVIYAGGRAPALEQFKVDLVLPYLGYTGFALPKVKYFNDACRSVGVTAGNVRYCAELLADVDGIVSQEYKVRLPLMITRTVLSVLAKEAATAVALEATRGDDGNLNIWTLLAASIYKYTFNTADTRCWEMLPKVYYMTSFPMPADRKVILHDGLMTPKEVFLNGKSRLVIIYIRGIDRNELKTEVWNLK